MIYLDTETCGLVGPIVLLQYAEDDGPIIIHDVWKHKVRDTLDILEHIVSQIVCGFNLTFDWFHICQMYTTMKLLNANKIPDINEYALAESEGRFGPCLKPAGALDLMLHARKGPYQSTMKRDPIRIKKIPTLLANVLADELNQLIQLRAIYSAKSSEAGYWKIEDITDSFKTIDPRFKNLVLRFAPSTALKALVKDALHVDDDNVLLFTDVEPPRKARPFETGYAPFATAPYTFKGQTGIKMVRNPSPDNWYDKWPDYGKIRVHIDHWAYSEQARKYASNDVHYLRLLQEYFKYPEPNDVDSLLACMVGAIRWRGYSIDLEKLKTRKDELEIALMNPPCNFNSSRVCQIYLEQVMSETEKAALIVDDKITTKGIILQELAKWTVDTTCTDCNGFGCEKCGFEGLIKSDIKHPAAIRAQQILDYRHGQKEYESCVKLLHAGRFHVDLNIIGTKSNRKSGSGGLNAQGMKRAKDVRRIFTLADLGLVLCGGDFDAFEVGLQEAAYKDPKLREDLLKEHDCLVCNGTGDGPCKNCKGTGKERYKMHGLFGEFLLEHEGLTYFDILKTKGLPGNQDKYDICKRGVFALSYGGDENTLEDRLGIPKEYGARAYKRWCERYVVWGQARAKIFDMFCSMRQPNGLGTKVEWHEPAEYIESMFGFKRYFTLENMIVKTLFNLAENPPEAWKAYKGKIVRRDREQTFLGAVRSALFAAAFGLQADNMRAAANHVIQSSGASITKMLEAGLWEFQPVGISEWMVMPLNVHDELMTPTHPTIVDDVETFVYSFIESMRPTVPLIGMDWKKGMATWADK